MIRNRQWQSQSIVSASTEAPRDRIDSFDSLQQTAVKSNTTTRGTFLKDCCMLAHKASAVLL